MTWLFGWVVLQPFLCIFVTNYSFCTPFQQFRKSNFKTVQFTKQFFSFSECHQRRSAQDRAEHPEAARATESPQVSREGHPGERERPERLARTAADHHHAHQSLRPSHGHRHHAEGPGGGEGSGRGGFPDPQSTTMWRRVIVHAHLRWRHPRTVHQGDGERLRNTTSVSTQLTGSRMVDNWSCVCVCVFQCAHSCWCLDATRRTLAVTFSSSRSV